MPLLWQKQVNTMNRSDLKKLSKKETINLFLTMHDHFQTKIAKLEAKLNPNSQNSHKPPQLTPEKTQPHHQKTNKKPDTQPKHKKHKLKTQHNPDQTITHKPTIYKHYQTSLTKTHAHKQTHATK
ncbi:MAG: DUF6444 domain-containing protein [Nitrososphaerota archaeon]|jgi:hypothetical protein|nr:DUF6444 domain-containing protein [Nitrososphaerota archaeon]